MREDELTAIIWLCHLHHSCECGTNNIHDLTNEAEKALIVRAKILEFEQPLAWVRKTR